MLLRRGGCVVSEKEALFLGREKGGKSRVLQRDEREKLMGKCGVGSESRRKPIGQGSRNKRAGGASCRNFNFAVANGTPTTSHRQPPGEGFED